MNTTDTELLEDVKQIRNLSDTTIRGMRYALEDYLRYNKKSFKALLKEAEKEEEDGVRWKHRTLRKRLLKFRTYCYEKHSPSTARRKIGIIKTLYRTFEIELQPLPPMSNKKPEYKISFDDLPTRTIISEALRIADPLMRAVIFFITSSGCARMELINLTIHDFLEATREYHHQTEVYPALERMIGRRDIVPTWRITRQKTGKEYHTFSTPESTASIVSYLLTRKDDLTRESKLFKVEKNYLNKKFILINEELNLGKKGHHNRFRMHMLRKYHASQLHNGDDSLTLEEIDSLQGRSKEKVQQSYFLDNPEDLKKKYVQSMYKVMVNWDYDRVTVDSVEFQRLKDENDYLKSNIKKEAAFAVQEAMKEFWDSR